MDRKSQLNVRPHPSPLPQERVNLCRRVENQYATGFCRFCAGYPNAASATGMSKCFQKGPTRSPSPRGEGGLKY